MGQLTIADVRAKFPQYKKLSDRELADAIHGTHYPNMDRGQFDRSIGLDNAPTRDDRPHLRPTPDPQAVAAEFAAKVNALEFQSPPPDPRITPEQPQAPAAPAALPFIDQPPAATSPAPSAPVVPSGPIPSRAMPNDPVPQLNGPGAGDVMQELIDLGVLPQWYAADTFARPTAAAQRTPINTGNTTQFGRTIWETPEDGMYSEKTITIERDGVFFNVPTVTADGRILAPEIVERTAANWEQMVDPVTGEPLQSFATMQDAVTNAQSRSDGMQSADPFAGEGIGSLAARRGQQFARGATEAFAALPEAVAVAMAGADNRDVASGEYKMALAEGYESELGSIDKRIGEIEVALAMNGNPRPSRENRLDGNQRAALRDEYHEIMGRRNQINLAIGEGGLDAYRADAQLDMTTRANINADGVVTPASDRPIFAQGDRLRDASGEFFGVPDSRDTSFWSMVAEGGGNMTGMAVSALATTAVAGPVAGVSVAGAQGSGMNTASMYKESLEMGADEETAMEAASWGALIGASEIIPINRALKLLPPRLRGQISQGFLRRFADIAQSSGEEAAQEYLATVANNIVAQQLYDAERGWTEGATESALVGAILGAGTGSVGTLMDARADAPASTPEIRPRNGEEPPQVQADTTQPVAPSAEAAPVNAPAAPVADPTSREAPVQPPMPEPPLPVDEMAALMQPAPTPALPAENQLAPAEPVGQDTSSPQQPAGEPQLQGDPTSEARAGDFKPDQWEAIQGVRDGQPTGRTWMTNAETGETISKQEYDTRLQAQPAASPEGGGTDAPTQGATNEPSTQTPSQPTGTDLPAADVSGNVEPDGVQSGPNGPARTVADDNTNAAPTEDAVGDSPVGAAPVQGDPAPTVDAVPARPSPDAGVNAKTGEPITVSLHRGVKAGQDPATLQDGGRFLSTDPEIAGQYAGKDGLVSSEDVTFRNPLVVPNWQQAKKDLGLPLSTDMPGLINATKDAGYDALNFQTSVNGDEWVDLRGAQSTAQRNQQADWDAMTPDQRRDLMGSMEGTKTRDGSLNKTALKASEKGWGALSDAARGKISERWDALDQDAKSPISSADAEGTADPAAQNQEPVKNAEPQSVSMESTRDRWDAMNEADRIDMARRINPNWKPSGGPSIMSRPWDALLPATQERINEAMQREFREGMSTAIDESLKSGADGSIAAENVDPGRRDKDENSKFNRLYDMLGQEYTGLSEASMAALTKARTLAKANNALERMLSATAEFGVSIKDSHPGASKEIAAILREFSNDGVTVKASADSETLRAKPSKYSQKVFEIFDNLDRYEDFVSIRPKGVPDGGSPTRKVSSLKRDMLASNAIGYQTHSAKRGVTIMAEIQGERINIRFWEKTGAAADPAFKAAQDSGKLQVILVNRVGRDGKTDAERGGPYLGAGGTTVDAKGDRPMDVAGKYWDSLTPDQRRQMIVNSAPNAKPNPEFLAKSWADISDGSKASITRRMPDAPFEVTQGGKPAKAIMASGKEIDVEYKVVESADLIASNDASGRVNPAYPQQLQPRDRTRASSQTQIDGIAKNLKPELLFETPNAADGTPIIGPDFAVESGNGRVLAIQKAYRDGGADGYRDYLAKNGYADQVAGMKEPVLVRERKTDMTAEQRRAFTVDANERSNMAMSATERAMSDAASMPDSLLPLYRGGDIDASGNRDFLRGFIQAVVSENDAGQMIDSTGAVSQEAVRRVQGALLAKAYGDAKLVAALIESTDSNIKAIGGALLDVSGEWANMRQEAEKGSISANMDQTEALLEAVKIVNRARTAGRNVAEFVGQGDLLSGDTISENGKDFLALMFQNVENWTKPAGRDRITTALNFYIEEALKTSEGADLLGERANARDIARKAKENQYGQNEQTNDLFAGKRVEQDVPADGGNDRGSEPEASTVKPGPESSNTRKNESEVTTNRDLAVAGRAWDGMIVRQRTAILAKVPDVSGVASLKWASLSDTAQIAIANALPEIAFAGSSTPRPAKKEAAQDAPPQSNREEGNEAAQPDTDTGDNADQPTVLLGEHLASLIETDDFPSTNMQLMKVAADYFGGTIAEGAFSPKDAYESLELAMNVYATDSEMAENGLKTYDPRLNAAVAKKRVNGLQAILDTFPTQTRRDTETDAFQQFSTPPTYGYAVNWIANIKQGERVLEPSAGNGGIAIFAKNAGANVDVNELAGRRVPSLKALGFDRVTTENAEQIANIWSGDTSRSYDAVVMNPPFSASGDRGTKNTSATGAKHIDQALSMLKDGGRLVAIMGHTFQPGNSRVAPFFKRLEANGYSLRANVVVKGDQVYKKYGTTYDNRLLVIDKVAPVEGSETLKGEVATIPELIDMMEGIRNEASNRRTKDEPVATTAESASGRGGRTADADGGQSRYGKPERVSEPDDLGGATDPTGRDGRSDPADGKPVRTNGDSQGSDGKRKSGSNDAGKRPTGSRRTTPNDSRKPTVRVTAAEQTKVEETSGGFAKYRPTRVRVEGAKEHPIALVESSAMATVTPPMPNYDLQLPSKMVKDGLLSEAQLEQVMYAGAAHSEMLPANPDEAVRRKGYYIGDGTGVGKTREIAGIIADNWAQGRKKHILISKDKKLLLGARRDFDNVGMKSVPIQDLGKVKATGDVDADATGVLFATYSTIGKSATAGKKSRLDQIVEWVGPDFDGTITFDEAHLAGNAMPVKGKRGTSKPSATALAVVDLQKQLPNARVVYASATAATEVYNLAYADRLGLWGAGTAFPTVESFVTQIDKGGVAAMEVVARDMKQMGVYMARSISFDGVEYGKVEHELTADQRAMYDAAAEGWQTVLANVQAVIEDHTEGGGRQRGAALAQFWGAHQRFFQQVLTAMQMPTVLSNIEADLKAGLSPVIQIVNTNEAATKRAMARLEEGDSLDDIDITPREDLMQYLETSFPIHQYESYVDDNGNERQRPVQDSNGDYVVNKEAVRTRDELVGKLGAMTLPGNPLDMIIDKFGPDRVAEITGRSQRIVTKDGKRVKERRSQNKALAEAGEFQNAKRDVLIFSDAGGTGMDFHADKGVKNTKRRSHYVLQAGWRADRAIQGFGRTHRTNQAQPPIYKLAGTNLSGHKRFTSSIARRLDQLGALTKGQKDASGSSMFSATDNLENEFADTAVEALFYEIFRGDVEGFTPADAERELGLNLVGEKGFNVSKIPPVTQFLNRLLNAKIDRQNMLFDRFVEHMETAVQQAIEDGQFTAGVEAIEHDGAVLSDTKEAYRDTTTAATSQYQMVKLTKKVQVTPFVDIDTAYATIRYKKDRESGAVYAFRPASSRTNDRGQVIQTYHRYSPTDRSIIDSGDYQFRYDMIKPDEAELGWNEAIKDAPATREETLHMVTGALLPIWDRLPSSSPKIVRLQLDDGRSLLGREIPDIELTRTLENLGVTGPEIDMTGAEIQAAVLQGKTIVLSSGHKVVRRRVGGEQRIEIISPTDKTYSDTMPGGTLQKLGFQIEKINYKNRAFAGTSEKGLPALDAFMAGKNIINVTMERDQVQGGPIQPYGDDMASGPVFKALSAQMRKMGLDDVQIQFDPSIAEQGKVYTDHFGKMVVTIGQTQNLRWTMGHEAMHIYRHMGLLSKSEWNVLSSEAENKWMERYDIEARYPDLTKAERIEEAVAEAFGEAVQKSTGFRTTGPVRAAFRQINNFLKAVRNWSKGLGLKTPEDVMEAMARGVFAKRKNVEGWESQTSRLIKQRRQPNDIERKQGGMFLPDRYVWDTLAHGNGNIFARIKEAKGALGDRMDLIRTRIQDRFLPVLRAQQVIEREMKGPIPEELNAYLAEEMYSGRAGYKLDMIDQDYTSKIIQIIGNTKGVTAETVGRFLYARHAAERNKRIAEINPDMPDGGSGMGTAEADAILKDIKSSPQASAYEDIAELIDNLREWSIQERLDMGLMTKDEATAWRKAYDAYVPLKGWAETDFADAELDVTGIGRGYNVRGDETRRALGRKTAAFNPLVAAITQAQEVAVRGEKNRVGQHLYRLAKDVPAKGLWEVKKTETTRVFNESTGLVEERNMSPITMMQAANEMAVKVDGEEHRIIFNDHRLARSATRVGVDNLGAIMTPLSMFSRYISTINTMLNPEFVLTNFARDTVTANVNMQSKELGTKIQKGMMRDLPKAMAGAYRGIGGKSDTEWSKYFKEFSEAGAKVSFWVMENPQANQSSIEKRIKREANGAKGVALALVTPSTDLNPVLSAMNRINLAVDNAIRLAAFVHARKNGLSAQEAASLSKNLTVNFNRRGDYGSAINAAYVFANAAMQGTHIMFKALKSRRVQMIVTGMVLVSYLLDQANAYLSEEDEDGQLAYDKLPSYRSERSLIIMLGPDAGDALTIPMPYGYNVFTYMGNRLSKMQRGAITPEEALGDTALAAFNSFSPISGGSFMGMITPTVLDPALDIAVNEDWLGRSVYPDYPNMTGPDSQRFFGSVTDGSRLIAEKMNAWTGGTYAESGYVDVSPETLDHISGYLTGGTGRFFGRTTDMFAKIFRGEDVEVNDVPVARTLYTDTGEWLDRSQYFDRRTAIREANAAAKAYTENGDPVPADVQWMADLYPVQLQAEKYRRGTSKVAQDVDRAYLLLNTAYLRAWQANTPYSSESIFD